MKPSELRIGNLVKDRGGKILRIDWFEKTKVCMLNPVHTEPNVIYAPDGIMQGHPYTEEFSRISPIPLDAEWLERFPEMRNINGAGMYWLPLTNLKAELHFDIYGNEIVTTIKSDFCNLILDPIKWVHSLQNIYYALSNGRELALTHTELTTKKEI